MLGQSDGGCLRSQRWGMDVKWGGGSEGAVRGDGFAASNSPQMCSRGECGHGHGESAWGGSPGSGAESFPSTPRGRGCGRGYGRGARGGRQTKMRGRKGRERRGPAESGSGCGCRCGARRPGRQSALGRQEETGRHALLGIRGCAVGVGGPGDAGRRLYWSIRLCHTRGAADNFITSAYKNDCGRMQMARRSRPPASPGATDTMNRLARGSSSRAPAPLGRTAGPPWL